MWTEQGFTSFGMAKQYDGDLQAIESREALAKTAMKVYFEVLSMRAQYYLDTKYRSMEAAR